MGGTIKLVDFAGRCHISFAGQSPRRPSFVPLRLGYRRDDLPIVLSLGFFFSRRGRGADAGIGQLSQGVQHAGRLLQGCFAFLILFVGAGPGGVPLISVGKIIEECQTCSRLSSRLANGAILIDR